MSQPGTEEVVITGIGLVSPIGIGVDAFQKSIADGQCGFRKTEYYEYLGVPGGIGGEVSDFTESTARKQHLKAVRKQIKVMCREIQLGVASALQAMTNAGLEKGTVAPERIGVDFGANLMSSPPEVLMDAAVASSTDAEEFDFDRWGVNGDGRFRGMEPLWLLRFLPNMPGCHIGIAIDARGPNNSLTLDEASGGLVLAEAANIIQRGRADVMVTGTTGTRIHPVKVGQHEKWDIIADGPADERCKPFDRKRNGEVLSEGSCTLILESRSHAESRGAKIYGTLLSTAATCVAATDGQPNEQQAVEQAAKIAVERAGLNVADLGHINACASGHPIRDAFEARALASLTSGGNVPVTALKSYLGSSGCGNSPCRDCRIVAEP